MRNQLIYLDHAAASPLDKAVLKAMLPYFRANFFNPSSPYLLAKKVKAELLAAKSQIGRVLGVKASELIFTAGATESVNFAIKGVMNQFPDGEVVCSSIEHPAVLNSAANFKTVLCSVKLSGLVDLEALKNAISPKTVLVSIGYANSELGTIQPLKKIAALIELERQNRLKTGNKRPIYFHTDATQTVGHLDLHVSRLGVDLLSLSAAKAGGPKQAAILWKKAQINLTPLIDGGGQEQGLRSGTENVALALGLASALSLAEQHRAKNVANLTKLRDDLQTQIVKALPQTVIINQKVPRLANFLHLAWSGVDAERLLIELDLAGVMVATGSACAANKGTRSHVLTAIKMPASLADGSLRLSLGVGNSAAQLKKAGNLIIKFVGKQLSK